MKKKTIAICLGSSLAITGCVTPGTTQNGNWIQDVQVEAIRLCEILPFAEDLSKLVPGASTAVAVAGVFCKAAEKLPKGRAAGPLQVQIDNTNVRGAFVSVGR